jgi:NADP-dependent 3-hydroxy acid dehydrogenase YdfG
MNDARRRTALVTGASRGIGLEVARLFAADGIRVAMLARSLTELDARAREIGADAIAIRCDVAKADDVTAATSRVVAEFGDAPDIVVNNAGLFNLASIENTALDAFRAALDVNLVAPFLVVRTLIERMRTRRDGHIVTIGSIADRSIFPENAAYASSKFGVRAFHEVLRAELRGSGIRATLVSPAQVDTAMWDEIDPDSRPGFTPRRDMLPARAVADAVRYAVSQPADVNVDELRISHS